MNDTIITPRQRQILEIIKYHQLGLSRSALATELKKSGLVVSRVTLIRDLNSLMVDGQIESSGTARSTRYILISHPNLIPIDINDYFSQEVDQRIIHEKFSFEVFHQLSNLFSESEILHLDAINQGYRQNLASLSPDLYKKELERFLIELSWKSSRIEGNTYSLLETEALIKEATSAPGHPQHETQMILNHQRALEVILEHPDSFRNLSIQDIINIHQELVRDLGVSAGIRQGRVRITGTKYLPPDNEWQLREALDKLVAKINSLSHPIEKAFVATAMLSYIQSFGDGNKRTARLIGNALLLAYQYAPLSYRNIDEVEYKKSLVLVYEQHNFYHLKRLFIEQFEFAVANYFDAGVSNSS